MTFDKTLKKTLKKAQQRAKAAREDFETAFLAEGKGRGAIAKGEALKFGYNFGRLAVAVVDETDSGDAR